MNQALFANPHRWCQQSPIIITLELAAGHLANSRCRFAPSLSPQIALTSTGAKTARESSHIHHALLPAEKGCPKRLAPTTGATEWTRGHFRGSSTSSRRVSEKSGRCGANAARICESEVSGVVLLKARIVSRALARDFDLNQWRMWDPI